MKSPDGIRVLTAPQLATLEMLDRSMSNAIPPHLVFELMSMGLIERAPLFGLFIITDTGREMVAKYRRQA